MAAVLEAKGVTLAFPGTPKPVLTGVDLSVERGEFVAVVGGSGVGKSTLLRVLAGLLAPNAGSVALSSPEREGRRRRAVVFQDSRLMPWRTLAANVRYGLEGIGVSAAARRERVAAALALTGLDGLGDRYPHQLSGGQAQRGGIARALATEPDVLLMDEPFSAVDALTRAALQEELLRIWRASGAAVVFVTHDIGEAVYLADRILVLTADAAGVALEVPVTEPRPRDRAAAPMQALARRIAEAL